MEDQPQRLTRWRRNRSLAVGVSVLLAIAAVAAFRHDPATADGGERSLIVSRQPFTQSTSFVGTIQSVGVEAVFAPFDGVVRSLSFAYGERARKGQILATLDTAEIMDERDVAEADYLKARQAMADMAGWANGPDMTRARRAKAAATMEMQAINRDIGETRALLDKGLVPRSEYDALVQRRRSQQLAMASVSDEYEATAQRGTGLNLRIATLDLDRARTRLSTLIAQIEGAAIRAPADGVLARPPQENAQNDGDLHVGSHLSKGQLVATVARSGILSASFKLDEIDVNRIGIGQRVTITGPAFGGETLRGRVSSIGGEALKGTGQITTKASFAATARLDPLPPAIAEGIRPGMTATITVEIYASPSAVVVPGAAVKGASPAATVSVRHDGKISERPVTIGGVGPDGVEIRAGLKPGDVIVWQEPSAQAAGGE